MSSTSIRRWMIALMMVFAMALAGCATTSTASKDGKKKGGAEEPPEDPCMEMMETGMSGTFGPMKTDGC